MLPKMVNYMFFKKNSKLKFTLFNIVITAMLLNAPSALAENKSSLAESKPSIKVTLLGTGTPEPSIQRFGSSALVEAGPEKMIFDAGAGTGKRLWQLGIPIGKAGPFFLTHLHSDHTVDIPDIWLNGYVATPYGGRKTPLEIYGPEGTQNMMLYLRKAFDWDIRGRENGPGNPVISFNATEIKEGVVFNRNGVMVTAFLVDHGHSDLTPAFGYRVDYAGKSVVISGDTRFNENLIKHAKGTDVLIHEVTAGNKELLAQSKAARGIVALHTPPDDAGRVFSVVKPKLAVYTHIVLLGNSSFPAPSADDLIPLTRETYKGPLVVGEDLMRINIGDEVSVEKLKLPAH
ncbi:MBL fold metallo-hydrolase [Serratia sp. DD3]|uniref:MBL fold metallo-hydrolase n=1 Tax=Serratia sp. DD3 TaxID=1410619 RepID=UPI0004DA30BE|nr:MBL fold metallo-hydrolase [Serratia sp. DD3]KEY58461.1 ribonuclease Z [Serratia sp. DD3]